MTDYPNLPRAARRSRSSRLWLCLVALGMWTHGQARAQDIRDVVRDHLAEELEHKPEAKAKSKHKARRKPAAAARGPRSDQEDRSQAQLRLDVEPDAPAPETPPLPQRVLGPYLQLDVTLGGGYRGWLPQQFPHVKVAVGTYYVWTIDVKAKLFKFRRGGILGSPWRRVGGYPG